jgi:hypothetical protein
MSSLKAKSLSEQDPAVATLAEHADAIRQLGKQTVENIVEIGRRLTEAKAESKKLGLSWGDWLEVEFKWSDQQARRFIHIFERKSQLNNLLNANLPVSALYLLAAPSTPKEARDAIIEHAQTGEPVSIAETKRIIEDARGRKQSARKPRKPTTKSQSEKNAGDHKKAFGEALVDKLIDGFDVPLKPAHDRIARRLHKQFSEAPGEVQQHFVPYFLEYLQCDINLPSAGEISAGEIARKDAEIERLRGTQRHFENKIAELESELEEAKAAAKSAPESKSGFRCSICRRNRSVMLRPVFICDGCVNIYDVREATPTDNGVPDILRRAPSLASTAGEATS